ncbi:histidine kinase N-terminal 7TM domain-containing diguanylate cyclase [Rossellomorea aquimaris]|uniref:Diguanylate cyclase n=1 Tax=Rossellomorea aquimaris TaxID=189382 RepID=A0A5D4TIT7_9BACI|nr:diguanylate cyclase [Rossellomorea aquimaris]TYS74969.1 diguanylate cyclase [Rossellomorea aquimaris]
MNSEVTAYITLICTSSVLSLYLSFFVYSRRLHYKNIAPLFILHTMFNFIYCVGSAFVLLSSSLPEIKFWTIVLYAGMPFSPALGLMFIMRYLGMKLTAARWAALLTIPFISLIMVATNDFHHLHYKIYEIDAELGAPFVHQEIGQWYVIHGLYTFGSLFAALLLLLSRWKETAKAYRPQLISLIFAQLVPIITAFIYLIGITPTGIDPVPMVLWVTSLCYFWSISTSRMFTLMPIAKDAIFQSINDGVVVLDESQRLIEFNQASKEMFPGLSKDMLGIEFLRIWENFSGQAFPYEFNTGSFQQKLQFTVDGPLDRAFQVRVSQLHQAHQKNGILIIFTDITEVKQLQMKLEHLAYHDELTQVYNRRAFFTQCKRAYKESQEDSSPFTVIIMDIDHFKSVNDTYGHNVGDQLLVHVVKSCQSQLKKEDLFARYGGEEFVLALKGYTCQEAESLAERIRLYLETEPFKVKDINIVATMSFGVAEAEPENAETLFDLLNKADKALYSAKAAGRNRVQVYHEEEILI